MDTSFKHNRYLNNDFVDLCIKKFFDQLYITKKFYQIVDKKQSLIILPFLGHLPFETRNRLNSCKRNLLPSCSLSIAFQSKTHHLAHLNSKTVLLNTFTGILFITSVVAAMHLIMVKLGDTFLYEHRSICESLHWQKRVKNQKQSANMDHIYFIRRS